uniref:F-actin-capping protein subunit alpha n=1 Tax=Podarcis muralis TaxID=64176 RepID=A0A670KKW7_PODMU
MSNECELSEEEKTNVICSLLQQAPPGEYRNVFEDLRILAHDDHLMRYKAAQVCANHTRKNFTAVRVKGENALVTRYNDLGGNRFFDPQIKLSFRFDHLTKRVDKVLLYHSVRKDRAELWRETLNIILESYMRRHFLSGDCRVYKKMIGSNPFFVVCIEAHRHDDICNAVWKSEWTIAFAPPTAQVAGKIDLQAHYFKKANLHWTASKDVRESIYITGRVQFAIEFVKLVEAEESKFQTDLVERLQKLSDKIWRALRRPLPVTRTVISWDKLLTNVKEINN